MEENKQSLPDSDLPEWWIIFLKKRFFSTSKAKKVLKRLEGLLTPNTSIMIGW